MNPIDFKNIFSLACLAVTLLGSRTGWADAGPDGRELVELPPMMQSHMLANMRDHLAALHEMLSALSAEDPDRAADIAERRLGMSSMEQHGAGHMAPFMPEEMRRIGTSMHQAASRFARIAVEGDMARSYAAVTEVTVQCIACHAGFRIR